MMLINSIKENIDIAIAEAIVTYGDKEGQYALDIFHHYNMYRDAKTEKEKLNILLDYAPHFNDFNVEFKVARKYISAKEHPSKRLELLKLIFDYFLPEIESKRSLSIIQEFTTIVKNKGLSIKVRNSNNHQFILSPISEIAFLFAPTIYFPYDSKAKNALNIYIKDNGLNYKVHGSYENYMNIFNKVFEVLSGSVSKEYIIEEKFLSNLQINFNINCDKFNLRINRIKEICMELGIADIYEFIIRRVVDKALMLQGGFEDYKLVAFKQKYLVRK